MQKKDRHIVSITSKRFVTSKNKKEYELLLEDCFGNKHSIILPVNLVKGIVDDKEIKRLNGSITFRIEKLTNRLIKEYKIPADKII